jgi:hypothetical protein
MSKEKQIATNINDLENEYNLLCENEVLVDGITKLVWLLELEKFALKEKNR